MASGEKRTNRRAPVLLRIKLRYPSIERFVEKFATNISRGGMFISSRSPKPVETKLRFELRLADNETVIKGSGTVRWIREYDPKRPRRPYGMGIEFEHLTDSSQEILERIIQQRLARGLPDNDQIPLRARANTRSDTAIPEHLSPQNSEPVQVDSARYVSQPIQSTSQSHTSSPGFTPPNSRPDTQSDQQSPNPQEDEASGTPPESAVPKLEQVEQETTQPEQPQPEQPQPEQPQPEQPQPEQPQPEQPQPEQPQPEQLQQQTPPNEPVRPALTATAPKVSRPSPTISSANLDSLLSGPMPELSAVMLRAHDLVSSIGVGNNFEAQINTLLAGGLTLPPIKQVIKSARLAVTSDQSVAIQSNRPNGNIPIDEDLSMNLDGAALDADGLIASDLEQLTRLTPSYGSINGTPDLSSFADPPDSDVIDPIGDAIPVPIDDDDDDDDEIELGAEDLDEFFEELAVPPAPPPIQADAAQVSQEDQPPSDDPNSDKRPGFFKRIFGNNK